MDISIIIVNWNTRDLLEICLSSIISNIHSTNYEIIVVDNGSTDNSTEMVSNKFPEVLLIKNNSNLGFSKANNLGISASKGDYICLINSDISVNNPNLFHDLLAFMEKDETIGILAPRIVYPDGRIQHSCKNFPTLKTFLFDTFALSSVFKNIKFFNGEEIKSFRYDEILKVNALAGAFWVVRRKLFDTIGLLDENFFFYSEDIDFCKRTFDKGFNIVFYPFVTVTHNHAASSSSNPNRFYLEQRKSKYYYWQKHNGLYFSIIYIFLLKSCSLFKIIILAFGSVINPSKRYVYFQKIKALTAVIFL